MRRSRAPTLMLLALLAAAPAGAQGVVSSAGPDDVDVTLYRDPGREPGNAPALDWLAGYALISETRRIVLPGGESEIRFEGVAGGILPQSAIVTGFPEGIVERNRDAYLLSPGTLVDRSLGRRVMIRRTSRATGAVRQMPAIIRSGADGALVLQTPDGFEALRCSGLPEGLIFSTVPPGLSPRPTLSVRARARSPVSATVTLSYLASGFDWEANYIARLSQDGRRIELLGWLTLASTDETGFRDADTQAVAGRLHREEAEVEPREGGPLDLTCWPAATTSDGVEEWGESRPVPPVSVVDSEQIRLQGTVRTEDLINELPQAFARQEDLGDLKLYRIPEPVTLAANSQKQVAFLSRDGVAVRFVYRHRLFNTEEGHTEQAERYLVTRNREAEGLGLPLPGGGLVLFGAGERPVLLGEGALQDRAVGEDVEIALGEAPGVRTELRVLRHGARRRDYELVVSNDGAEPAPFEALIEAGGRRLAGARLPRRDGMPLWAVTVPANGSASLRYSLIGQE